MAINCGQPISAEIAAVKVGALQRMQMVMYFFQDIQDWICR